MIKQKQHGFSVITLLLFVVVIGAVGFAGWYVYSQQNNTKTSEISINKATQDTATEKDWCDSYEGFCFTYKTTWKVQTIDNSKTYDMTIGAQAVKITSLNGTAIIYNSGINNAQNGPENYCGIDGENDMSAYTHVRQTVASAPNVEYLWYSLNKDKKDTDNRYTFITKDYLPGNTPEAGCATMVTRKDGKDEYNITLMSTFTSKSHPGQYVILSTTDTINPADKADVEALFSSAHYIN
jgi:cytoskeletal protein RodZ